MPAPVIFGAIIDGTCLLWKYTCDERQSCYLYDIVFFRNAIHGYSIVATSLATLIVCLLYGYFRVKGITQWRSSERKAHLEKSINIDHEVQKPDSNHVSKSDNTNRWLLWSVNQMSKDWFLADAFIFLFSCVIVKWPVFELNAYEILSERNQRTKNDLLSIRRKTVNFIFKRWNIDFL